MGEAGFDTQSLPLRHADGNITFVPLAVLLSGNPYRTVNPPRPEGGFYSQEEIWHDEEPEEPKP